LRSDPGFQVSDDAAGREAQERETIAAILAKVPQERRHQLGLILQDRSVTPSGTSDPDLAPLLGALSAIRVAMLETAIDRARADDNARGGNRGRVRVTVAMVPRLSSPELRAAVLRQPGDEGIPVLLLPASTVTEEDLERGLRAAVAARDRYGKDAAKVVTLSLRVRADRPSHSVDKTKWSKYLHQVRVAPVRTIPGVGQARAMDMMARRPGP
jgi:hypothetical protein